MSTSKPNSASRRSFFRSAAANTAALAAVPSLQALQIEEQNSPTATPPPQSCAQDCTDEGRMPLAPTDSSVFNEIVLSANVVTSPRLSGPDAPVSFPAEFLPIDASLHNDPDFGLDSIPAAARQFRFWQLESLLDQAADLLDRCVKERAEYDQLRTQWTKLFLEVTEFERLEAIHEQEICAGWYTIVHDQSEQELAALKELVKDITGSPNWPDGANTDANQGYKTASALAKPGFDSLRVRLASLHDQQIKNERQGNFTGASLDRERIVEELGFQIQQMELAAQAQATDKQIIGRKAKEAFDKADICFRRERSRVAVLINNLKKKQMSDPGGPYNYIEQGRPIRKRFMRDFRDAYLRLQAAKDGLKKILNVTVSTPDFPTVNPQTPKSGIFDQALLWNREAIRILIALGHSDQAYALSVSLKTLLGAATWNQNVANPGTNSKIQFPFEFPANRLLGQGLVRLRGVSAFVVKNRMANGTWHLAIKPPRAAVGPNGSNSEPLIQNVPTVHLGSVDNRNSQQPAETVGTVVLRNISVQGHPMASPDDRTWKVEADLTSSTGERFQQAVADIEIELHLVVQAA